MSSSIKEELKKFGWYLSSDGIDICKEEIGKSAHKQSSTKDIINCALNVDLSEIGDSVLSDDLVKGKLKEFGGPCVLQIVKIRNASAPKANEDSSVAPRLLKLHLTDGHKTCIGIEHESFDKKLSLGTPPGTKVRLDGTIKLSNGFLLLNNQNISFLGGVVENLFNKWKSTKDAFGFSRDASTGEDAPPPFVSFGRNVTYQFNTSKPALQSSTKAGDDAGDDNGFSEQRESAIAKIKQNMGDSQGKSFAPGRSKINTTNIPSSDYVQRNEKQDYKKQDYNRQHSGSDFQRRSDHFKADENLCEQLIQMGFSRGDAINSLRSQKNNLERALDDLINNQNGSGSSRGARGGRSGNMRGRGGRRANNPTDRSSRYDQESQHQSGSATLFDYVESSMTKSKGKSETKSKKPVSPPQADGSTSLDDDALQEEYILEYVKELSLVETGRSRHEEEVERRTEAPSDSVRSENSGVSRYRSGGNRRTLPNDRREDESHFENKNFHSNRNRPGRYGSDNRNRFRGVDRNDEDASGYERPPRRENFNSKTFLRSEPRSKHERYSRDDQIDQSNSHGDTRQRNRSENFTDRSQNNEKRRFNNSYSNPRDYSDDFDDIRPGSHRFGGDRRNDGNDVDRRKSPGHYYPDRQQKFVPPRLQKKLQQEQTVDARRTDNDQPSDVKSKKSLTLGDTARQLKTENQSLPARPPPTVHSNSIPPFRQRPSASHSYQDQRQQQMSRPGQDPAFPDQHSGQRRTNDDPMPNFAIDWKPGMQCLAKYWEDGQLYRAVVTDVHVSEPTAVVLFVKYGNSEEVYFDDLHPFPNTVKRPNVDKEGYLNSATYPNDRRGPSRPSLSLYQPPIPK